MPRNEDPGVKEGETSPRLRKAVFPIFFASGMSALAYEIVWARQMTLIFGVSDVLNLAHGEFLMLGGLVTFFIFEATGLNPFLTGLLMVPTAFFLGYVFDRFLMRPLATKKEHIRLMSSILVTLGAALTIEDVTSYLFGAEEKGVDFPAARGLCRGRSAPGRGSR